MDLDALTPTLIERALRALQQAQPPPAELLQLTAVQGSEQMGRAGRILTLETLLTTLVTQALATQRQREGLRLDAPNALHDRRALVENLAADFGRGNAVLESWSAVYFRYLSPLPFDADELARSAHVAPQQFRRRVNQGLAYLVTELSRAELEARRRQGTDRGLHVPPADYTRLFGVDRVLAHLMDHYSTPETPDFLSIEGLGGIGKTALARALAQRVLQQRAVVDVLWVSARQAWFSDTGELVPATDAARSTEDIITRLTLQARMHDLAGADLEEKVVRLRHVFQHNTHLIVIDNLETLEDVGKLLPVLHHLSGQSRFLLTSRHTLAHFPYVKVFDVPELGLEDSQALLNHELQRRARRAQVTPDDLARVYATFGGVPLALKLVAAQLYALPLETVLAGISQGARRPAEQFYTYLYFHTWRLLAPPAQHLLLSMLAIDPEGEDAVFLQDMSALTGDDFEQALVQLLDHSLIEIDDSLTVPHYRLHRMTVTFLQTNILARW